MREPLPLATIHDAVLEFLRGRDDVVVFGGTAVNAYVDEPRMTQDINLMSTCGHDLAEKLRSHLSEYFHIAVAIRVIGESNGYRLFQTQNSGNRDLVQIRPVESLPPSQTIENIRVLTPADLIALKVTTYNERRGKPKAGTDRRDLAMLLLTFPDLKNTSGPVTAALNALNVNQTVMNAWRELVAEEIVSPDHDSEFN